MAIDVVRMRERKGTQSRRVLDVSDVPATRVAEYAREARTLEDAAETDVYLEHKGGRTFLVAGGPTR
ncbi:hypothetical protein [Halomarina litorea]|uniref:hypothetical protein n=1 Tax=Halomarina litorea TaxID=2961595 RepID=UPI0020C45635|nr:hypothetical protein [Halomarina sp. BCD28]